jgi:hypothetical protein
MIDALAELLVAFPGSANRTRCFTHILNLVVKVILHQFDTPKAKAGEALDDASQALADLAGDIEMEEAAMAEGGDDDDDDNGDEGWFDPHHGMSQEEQEDLDRSVRPVWLVLIKVSSNSAHQTSVLTLPSFENSHTPLRTPPPSSFLAGCKYLKILQTRLAISIPSPSA